MTDVMASVRRAASAPLDMLDRLGEQLSFYARALAWTPRTLRRYKKEVLRLYGVLDTQLGDRDFLCDNYSIADIGTYPWVLMHDRFDFDLMQFPNLLRWYRAVRERPAVQRAYAHANAEMEVIPPPSKELLHSLFGETADLLTPPAANFTPKPTP